MWYIFFVWKNFPFKLRFLFVCVCELWWMTNCEATVLFPLVTSSCVWICACQVGSHSSYGPPLSPSSVLSAGSFEWGYVPEAGQPSTADLIASQSQDYIDERLQEFQATIVQLQSKSDPAYIICLTFFLSEPPAEALNCFLSHWQQLRFFSFLPLKKKKNLLARDLSDVAISRAFPFSVDSKRKAVILSIAFG